MHPARPRFSLFVHFYLVMFFLLFALAHLPRGNSRKHGQTTGLLVGIPNMANGDRRLRMLREPALLQ